MAFLDPVTLTGSLVQLEPLARSHADALRAATLDGRVWELWYTSAPAPDDVEADIVAKRKAATSGQGLPFALRRAFTAWGCRRVAFRATWFNHPSQEAIERLGAVFEGRIRNDRVLRDGTVTDTAQYSLTGEQWPAVERHLTHLLAHRA